MWAPALGLDLTGSWASLTYKNQCSKGPMVTVVTRDLMLSVERPIKHPCTLKLKISSAQAPEKCFPLAFDPCSWKGRALSRLPGWTATAMADGHTSVCRRRHHRATSLKEKSNQLKIKTLGLPWLSSGSSLEQYNWKSRLDREECDYSDLSPGQWNLCQDPAKPIEVLHWDLGQNQR